MGNMTKPNDPLVGPLANEAAVNKTFQDRSVLVMRRFLLRSLGALACLGVFGLAPNLSAANPDQSKKPNFNGTWTLDRNASTSLEPLMTRIGASYLERKFANVAGLKATFHQTEQLLTVATRGPGFALDETLYLHGRTVPSNLELLGAISVNVRAAWSNDHQQLVETRQIQTKNGKPGELIITRQLINQGKSMLLGYNLKLSADPHTTFVRQTWNKQA
jgi:hypothetical protein